MSHEVVRIRSGALAMRSLETGEVMHPGVGPLAEAEQLYVRQSNLAGRLRGAPGSSVVVFDVGLGAGSNAIAARSESERAPAEAGRLEVISFERDLSALALALEHPSAFALEGDAGEAARALLTAGTHQTPRSTWSLQRGDILEALEAAGRDSTRADIVFWDPYSPRANPSLWTVTAFQAVLRVAGPRCTLFTYSASTATRIALLLAGWAVGIGDAIGDKAETTAAAMEVADLARPLDWNWCKRLLRPDVPLPSDAPPDAIARAGAARQF